MNSIDAATKKFMELTIASNGMLYPAIIIAIVLLLSIGFYYFSVANVFVPGSQYKNIVRKMSRRNSKKLSTKDIEKEEVRRERKKQTELRLLRLRWNMNPEELAQASLNDTMLGFMVGIPLAVVGLTLFDGMLGVLFALMGVIYIFYMAIRVQRKFSSDWRQLNKDIVKDISRMVSLYKYSDTTKGFYGLVLDYMPTANSLKKDLEFYLSDLNTFGQEEALDKLGERVQVQEMFKLITYIKSSATATKAQFESNLAILDSELTDVIKELNRKESNARFRKIIMTIIPLLAAVVAICISGQIVNISGVVANSGM